MSSKIIIFLLIICSFFFLSGCSVSFSSGEQNDLGGVFKSIDMGENWTQATLIPTITGTPKSIGALDNLTLIMDPSDRAALYYGSVDNGLFYTYDGANNWHIARTLGPRSIQSVAVDPKYKCSIYASSNNRVYKTMDCSRTWFEVYTDNNPKTIINSIAINPANYNEVYLGTSGGDILKSFNGGDGWRLAYHAPSGIIQKIFINKNNGNLIFASGDRQNFYRSSDGGSSWTDLENNLKSAGETKYLRDVVFSESTPGLIFIATQIGIFKSNNHGDIWEKVALLTQNKDSLVNAMAVSAINPQKIYYATNTTFYRSLDGGYTWSTKKLPSSRAGQEIIIDPVNDNIIYLTVKK